MLEFFVHQEMEPGGPDRRRAMGSRKLLKSVPRNGKLPDADIFRSKTAALINVKISTHLALDVLYKMVCLKYI